MMKAFKPDSDSGSDASRDNKAAPPTGDRAPKNSPLGAVLVVSLVFL